MPIDDALAQLGPSIKYPKIEPTSTSGNYILLPENEYHKDLLVSKERQYLGKNWYQAHEELAKENSLMLTIRQFVDFLNLLKSGKAYDENKNKIPDKESQLILDNILTQRDPFRGEWLDAKFRKIDNKMYIESINSETTVQPLGDCLILNKMPRIDLDYWLANANSRGLPPKNTPDGKLYYYFPKEGTVAGFGAYSGGVGLDCSGGPLVSGPGLGVRPVNILK